MLTPPPLSLSLPQDSGVSVNLLALTSDVEDVLTGISINIIRDVLHGNTSSVDPVTSVVSYLPNRHFFGRDDFIFEVCDSMGSCAQNIAVFFVLPVNDVPFANATMEMVDEDSSVTTPLLSLMFDVEDELTADLLSITFAPLHGTVAINPATGVATYVPDPDHAGLDEYIFQVCDLQGACRAAPVIITVRAIDDAPVAADIVDSTLEDVAYLINVREAVVDVDTASTDLIVSLITTTVTRSGPLRLFSLCLSSISPLDSYSPLWPPHSSPFPLFSPIPHHNMATAVGDSSWTSGWGSSCTRPTTISMAWNR